MNGVTDVGWDTISCGATIAFAVEAFKKGLMTKKDTDGILTSHGGIYSGPSS